MTIMNRKGDRIHCPERCNVSKHYSNYSLNAFTDISSNQCDKQYNEKIAYVKYHSENRTAKLAEVCDGTCRPL